jgi:hypothetical protein
MVEDQASNNFNALQLVRGHQTPGTFASPISKKAPVSGIIRLRAKGSCGIAYLLLTANKSIPISLGRVSGNNNSSG